MNLSIQKQFFATLAKRNLTEQRGDLIHAFTNGRTSSAADLTDIEGLELIRGWNTASATKQHTEQPLADLLPAALPKRTNWQPPPTDDEANHLRRRLIAMRYDTGHTLPELKTWCETMGAAGEKCKFNDYAPEQLRKLIAKYQKVVTHRKAK